MELTESIIQQMKEKILNDISHPYLKEQLELPVIDDEKLWTLMGILTSQNLPSDHIEKYAITVILIQLALDTHDLVLNDEDYDNQKKQQLTVLAGDYYSGLYYKYLANVPNIELIQLLASGIKIINENKIAIYKKELSTIEEFFTRVQLTDTVLYQKLAAYFEDSNWETFATDWIHLTQLLKNKSDYLDYIVSKNLIIDHLSTTSYTTYKIAEDWLDRYADGINKRIEHFLETIPKMTRQQIEKIINKEKINQPYYL